MGVKRPGPDARNPPPSIAEVEEKVQLHLYSPCAFTACAGTRRRISFGSRKRCFSPSSLVPFVDCTVPCNRWYMLLIIPMLGWILVRNLSCFIQLQPVRSRYRIHKQNECLWEPVFVKCSLVVAHNTGITFHEQAFLHENWTQSVCLQVGLHKWHRQLRCMKWRKCVKTGGYQTSHSGIWRAQVLPKRLLSIY
jgi:hypothetical protein